MVNLKRWKRRIKDKLSPGIPYTLLLRIAAIGFPTIGHLPAASPKRSVGKSKSRICGVQRLVGPLKPLKYISKQGPPKPNKGKYKISQRPA